MFCLSESDTFYLYPYPTDMRKSFYSLSGIVTNEMKRNVQDGEAFIFVNRSLTSMKILHAEYASIQILGYFCRLAGGYQGVRDSSPVCGRVVAAEQIVLSFQGQRSYGIFYAVVINFYPSVR